MQALDHRLLIGPLYNPAVVGAYAQHEQIRLFMPESAHSRDSAYDLVYALEQTRHFNQLFEQLPVGWEPDLVIWWDPVYQPIPPGMEDCPYPLALIPGDWNLAFGTVLQAAQAVDGVFADARLGPILSRAGIPNVLEWPGFAYDSRQIFAEPGLERIHDICFIGNMNPSIHPRRSRYLARVLSLKHRHRLFLRHGVWGQDYRRALNQSRIVLNYTICQVMNMRAYEAPACGALLFIESDNREVRSIFRDRESCVLYDDYNLIDLLEYYLEHEDERAAIAAAGQRIVAEYNYERHFERLLVQIPRLLEQRPAQRPILTQPAPRRYLQALNQITASNRLGAESAAPSLFQYWTELTRGLRNDQVWELNALLVMLFPHLDEHQTLQALYGISLEDLLKGFEIALALAPNHPVLRYHHGLVCEYSQDETQALWSYSRSIELMAGGNTAELEHYRDFILPFNKSGRGTDQLAFEWERIHYEAIEQGISPVSGYMHLLVSSIWQRIGRILARQGRIEKALTAYHNAHQNFPRASLLLEICKLELRYPEPDVPPEQVQAQVFSHCLDMLQLQPMMIGALPEILNPDLLVRYADWVYEQTSLYLELFPELAPLRLLSALVRVARGQLCFDWRELLDIPFRTDFYQWLCLILQRLESSASLKPFQCLRLPWALAWVSQCETAPELKLGCGMYWSHEPGVPEIGPHPSCRFQRTYSGDSQLEKGRCGPDRFPFGFVQAAEDSQLVSELLGKHTQVLLAVLEGWSTVQLRELLQAFEAGWADQPGTLLLLWAPPGCELSLADLEACLPDEMLAQLAWLDEELSLSDQACLLQQATQVLASPVSLFYSYWAASLQVPVAWISSPGWLPDQGQGGFTLPCFSGPAEALKAPLLSPVALPAHWLEPELRQQAWLNGLWQLRLWTEFGP